VVAVAICFTGLAIIGFTSKPTGSAEDDVFDSSSVACEDALAVLCQIRRGNTPEYLRQLRHLTKLSLQLIHETVDKPGGLVLGDLGQVGIDSRGLR